MILINMTNRYSNGKCLKCQYIINYNGKICMSLDMDAAMSSCDHLGAELATALKDLRIDCF